MPGPNFSLSGKVAVVTGASRGIGASVAIAIAHAGAAVALLARESRELDAVHDALTAQGHTAMRVAADVGDVPRIDAAFDSVMQTLGRIDILINNAGVEQVCASGKVTESVWDRIMDTNLKGAFFCAQAAARRMAPGSSVVNICSLASEIGIAGAAPYGASKSGLAGLTRALATEWAVDGIRVNGVGPGYFRTALTEPFYQDAQWQSTMLQKIPLRRFGQLGDHGTAGDLGGAAVFLCSDAAAYITGQILYVDGGYLASA
jgi:NAD(P)-dependent dehydrogenase (short-subunit alcohol dehydrogenase family)